MARGGDSSITFVDLTGKQIGSWSVIEYVRPKRWRCICVCGREKLVLGQSLRNGISRSCVSCANAGKTRTHGHSGTRIYGILQGMIGRCYNPKHSSFHNYGARGIKVCDEWINSHGTFKEWAHANGYTETLTIERVDYNGDYCPSNCKWIPLSQQNRNKRDSFFVEINGERRLGIDVAKEHGMSPATLYHRVKSRCLSVDEALALPVQKNGRPLSIARAIFAARHSIPLEPLQPSGLKGLQKAVLGDAR